MTRFVLTLLFAILLAGAFLGSGVSQNRAEKQGRSPLKSNQRAQSQFKPSADVGHPSFMSPHASPIVISGDRAFVVNTPADTVDVIDIRTRRVVNRIHVGIDPVSLAVRPDGNEVWVANHVSDSVSVIDTDRASKTYLQVVATIQDFDPASRATRFDEPVGIAFASNDKAYVALSSENKIAVVEVVTRKISKRLNITAQDPRAIVVRDGLLYVLPFESNNKSQLSGGTGKIDGDLVTFNAHKHAVANNNVLSIGAVMDIIKHPKVPDRDLCIFDTKTDKLVKTVDTLGTLLYGLTVDSKGRVFIAQTDARNDANGRAGTKKHGLAELENRAFLNQITSVKLGKDLTGKSARIDLEPLAPKHPSVGQALATPFAIQVTDDDSTLVVSAAGSDQIFTVDTKTEKILGRVKVDAVPRGIALESASSGKASKAWVLNAVANTVSVIDFSNTAKLQVVASIGLDDPTHAAFKRGRIAFNTASASTTGTFSCASCHPDGHTDQLLWVLKTPIVTGGNQIMPRSTMPVRGLRDTAPFHWDGIPGDPYGGNNSASVHRSVAPNSSVKKPESTTRHLVDGAMGSTMSTVGSTIKNDEGKPGALTAAQRDDMALFLLGVPYPPAQRRAYDNVVSDRAKEGFKLFHIDGDHDGKPKPNICGNCHRMPFWVSTNTPGSGMDAPTWRGAYDRFLILPQGRLNVIDLNFYRRVAQLGIPERNVWQFSWAGRRRFDPVWDMVLEGSTGYSGSFGRQVTLNKGEVKSQLIDDLLQAMEISDREGGVVLQGDGVFIDGGKATYAQLQFDAKSKDGRYVRTPRAATGASASASALTTGSSTARTLAAGDTKTQLNKSATSFSRAELLTLASQGRFVGTFTARHGVLDDVDHPQPALWTLGPIEKQRGPQKFPTVWQGNNRMKVSGRHIRKGAHIIVDGRRTPGSVTVTGETVVIQLLKIPALGMHLLQVQNPDGLFSNDFIFHVIKEQRVDARGALNKAIVAGDLRATKMWIARGADVNAPFGEGGTIPLAAAAMRGNTAIAAFLIEKGARVSASNRDGNTPLHIAAFFCHTDVVKLLLKKGASVTKRNARRESPVDVVSGQWSVELGKFYSAVGTAVRLKIDLNQVERTRPIIAKLLRSKNAK
jgi:YVTN family beta-propeller protein